MRWRESGGLVRHGESCVWTVCLREYVQSLLATLLARSPVYRAIRQILLNCSGLDQQAFESRKEPRTPH